MPMDSIRQLRRRGLAVRFLGAMLLCGSAWALSIVGCSQPPADDVSEPLVPEDYRSTFVQVRDCRNSIPHVATVRVWVNNIGADAYEAEDDPLPVGTMVVKEEFAGADCSDDAELIAWAVMEKQTAGYDADARDWRFQYVGSPSRNVILDGKATCITCHTQPECLSRDLMCTEQ